MKRCELYIEDEWLDIKDRTIEEHNLWVSSGKNKITDDLEHRLCEIVGKDFCVTVNSGSTALYVPLLIFNPDVVFLPNYGYPAAMNLVNFMNKPIQFIDIDENTLCIDPIALETEINRLPNFASVAVVAIEHNGYVSDHLSDIREVCNRRPNTIMVEDSCASFGEPKAGTYGHFSTFSFGPTKTFSCGEGGAIVLSDENLYYKAKNIVNKMNWRLSPMLQAYLLNQLKCYDGLMETRRKMKQTYINNRINLFPGVGCGFLSDNAPTLQSLFNKNNIEALHRYIPYQEEMPVSMNVYSRWFDLPFHFNLCEEDIKKVANTIIISGKM